MESLKNKYFLEDETFNLPWMRSIINVAYLEKINTWIILYPSSLEFNDLAKLIYPQYPILDIEFIEFKFGHKGGKISFSAYILSKEMSSNRTISLRKHQLEELKLTTI